MESKEHLHWDPWRPLRTFTGARIALGRAGSSLPTRAHLDFQLAHARARDAVNVPLNADGLESDLRAIGLDALHLNSLAANRGEYLQYPDRGRRLASQSVDHIRSTAAGADADIALVVADGLSATAVQRHAAPFLAEFMPVLKQRGYTGSPIAIVHQGRVAVGDAVAVAMGCRMAAVLIGERPGLSSPDSMGIYFTFEPVEGCPDAGRNCISNIHGSGLGYGAAADTLIYLATEADRLGLSGVDLKDESASVTPVGGPEADFLLD